MIHSLYQQALTVAQLQMNIKTGLIGCCCYSNSETHGNHKPRVSVDAMMSSIKGVSSFSAFQSDRVFKHLPVGDPACVFLLLLLASKDYKEKLAVY